MKKLPLIILILFAGNAMASSLPNCSSDYSEKWDNCFAVINADGLKYAGEFKDGKMHGQGTYTWANGTKDVGEFRNDMLNGFAIRYDKNGNILKEGIWKDDEFQYAQKQSSGSLNSNSKLNTYKEFCKEIGFTPGTEKFGDCVMKLMDKD